MRDMSVLQLDELEIIIFLFKKSYILLNQSL